MPAMPEISQRPGKKRLPEVFVQADPHHLRDSERNVDPAGKIRIKLDAVHEHALDPQRVDLVVGAEDPVHIKRGIVSDHHFFEQSPADPPQSPLDIGIVKRMALIQLR